MQDKLKKRGFSERVSDKSDKAAICSYLNEEIHRHVKLLQDQRDKNIAAYEAERTRIRRQARQEQSERAKNAKSEKTKDDIDQKKEQAYKELEERKNSEESKLQLDLVTSMEAALSELEGEENLFSERNISSYLGSDHSLQQVIEKTIQKLKDKGKSVDKLDTP